MKLSPSLPRGFQYGFKTDTCPGLGKVHTRRQLSHAYVKCVVKYRGATICQEPNGPMKNSDHTMLVTGETFCTAHSCVLGVANVYTICHWAKSVR